jgi:hypothetical protein
MKSREFASVSFVVVGLLYFAYGVSLLPTAIVFMDSFGPVFAVAMFVPTAVLIYLGFYIIRVRDRLAVQVLPEDETESGSRLSKRDLMAVAVASVGLFLIGLGLPGIIKVMAEALTITRSSPGPSVMGSDLGIEPRSFLSVVPEAARVGTELLFGLLLVWKSPSLAERLCGTRDARNPAA